MADFFVNLLRTIFFFIDKIVYLFIELMYILFMDISKANIFSEKTIGVFSNRIYALLGIFMLFKISFSLLSMITNPDVVTDKERGLGKIISRVITTLVLILIVPKLFAAAYDVQKIVLEENVIGNVILGVSTGGTKDTLQNAGKDMSFKVFSAFFTPSPTACQGIINSKDNKITACKDALGVDSGEKYVQALESSDMDYYSAVLNEKINGNATYAYTYYPLISTLVGAFVLYILLSFCIDIGVRVAKLGFLQLIAPIPIISYIDPKSSKDGAFSKWINTCVSTYFDLFVRLIIIYFVVFILGELTAQRGILDATKSTAENPVLLDNPFAYVFVILGALMFAKQAPQLIKDILGIKGDGAKFELNPFKKVSSGAIGGAAIGGVVGGAAGLGAGAIGGGVAGAFNTGSLKGAFAGVGRGALGGLQTGQKAGASGGNPFDAYRAGGNAAKQAATGNKSAVSGLGGFIDDQVRNQSKAFDKSIAGQYDIKWKNKSADAFDKAVELDEAGKRDEATKYLNRSISYNDKVNTRVTNASESKEAAKMKDFAKEVAKNMPKSK
jgi:hypothetical protein